MVTQQVGRRTVSAEGASLAAQIFRMQIEDWYVLVGSLVEAGGFARHLLHLLSFLDDQRVDLDRLS